MNNILKAVVVSTCAATPFIAPQVSCAQPSNIIGVSTTYITSGEGLSARACITSVSSHFAERFQIPTQQVINFCRQTYPSHIEAEGTTFKAIFPSGVTQFADLKLVNKGGFGNQSGTRMAYWGCSIDTYAPSNAIVGVSTSITGPSELNAFCEQAKKIVGAPGLTTSDKEDDLERAFQTRFGSKKLDIALRFQ